MGAKVKGESWSRRKSTGEVSTKKGNLILLWKKGKVENKKSSHGFFFFVDFRTLIGCLKGEPTNACACCKWVSGNERITIWWITIFFFCFCLNQIWKKYKYFQFFFLIFFLFSFSITKPKRNELFNQQQQLLT